MRKLILVMLFCIYADVNYSQSLDWTTVGGNSNRDGLNRNAYDPLSFSRIFNAPPSIWGMPVFSYGNKFVTSRYTSLNPLRALVIAFTYSNVNPVWTFGQTAGVNVVMGFNNDKVYVRDFQQNGSDTIFALNSTDGSILWKSRFTVERGIIWTAAFATNGDLIVPGSGNKRIMRINHLNGDTVWTNNRIIPNTGAETFCVNGNTLYAWQGTITTPKKIIAIDINTGVIKYESQDLPGDGDQEIPFTVSTNGIVYCIRDGGLMYALKDTGTGFELRWSRPVSHPVGTYTQISTGTDSSVYIPYGKKVYRLNHVTGSAMDSTIDLVTSGTINPRFAISKSGNIYIGNGADNPADGGFFVFAAQNLQNPIWHEAYSYSYYCGPAFGGETYMPFFLYTGGGTEIHSQFAFIDAIPNYSENAKDFVLNQNFPNPFNPETAITYHLNHTAKVILKVYNSLGNMVQTLVEKVQQPGSYNIEWNGSEFSSGVYFYTLHVNSGNESYLETRKMILAK